jgi:hypothetical protein
VSVNQNPSSRSIAQRVELLARQSVKMMEWEVRYPLGTLESIWHLQYSRATQPHKSHINYGTYCWDTVLLHTLPVVVLWE